MPQHGLLWDLQRNSSCPGMIPQLIPFCKCFFKKLGKTVAGVSGGGAALRALHAAKKAPRLLPGGCCHHIFYSLFFQHFYEKPQKEISERIGGKRTISILEMRDSLCHNSQGINQPGDLSNTSRGFVSVSSIQRKPNRLPSLEWMYLKRISRHLFEKMPLSK